MRGKTPLVRVVLIALLAGCVAAPQESPPHSSEAPSPKADEGFRIEGRDCSEGGAYVTWNAFPNDPDLPPGFATRHVAADLGDPPTNSLGGEPDRLHTPANAVPSDNVTGAYHPIMYCPTWILDGVEKTELWFAWVSALIHPPAYDSAPVSREYSAGAIGVNDADLAAKLEAAGFAPEHITVTDFFLDATHLRNAFAFDHHGAIYADVPMRVLGAKPSETTRLWVVTATGEGASRPIALDFLDEGGQHLVASAPGAFEHTVRGPAPADVVPIHTFTSWALGYTGVSRTITLGPATDFVLDGTHGH